MKPIVLDFSTATGAWAAAAVAITSASAIAIAVVIVRIVSVALLYRPADHLRAKPRVGCCQRSSAPSGRARIAARGTGGGFPGRLAWVTKRHGQNRGEPLVGAATEVQPPPELIP